MIRKESVIIMIRIIIADDQKLFLESLSTVLESFSDKVKVVGKASSGQDAIVLAKNLAPDIALIDIRMPNLDGIETAKRIRNINSAIKIILLTTFDDDEYIKRAMSLGVNGYILKDIEPVDLLNYITAVQAGATILHSAIAEKVQSTISGENLQLYDSDTYLREILIRSLTSQEKKILSLIVSGYSNKEISERLNISIQTVQNYVSSIYSKLDVNNRMHVIRLFKDFKHWNITNE